MLPPTRYPQSKTSTLGFYFPVIRITPETLEATSLTPSTRNIAMNSRYDPYGVISWTGPGQEYSYTPMGVYSRYWGRVVQRPGNMRSSPLSPQENSNYPAAQAYSNRQMANMQQQLMYDGDNRAYEWRMSMMSPAEMAEEWSRYS